MRRARFHLFRASQASLNLSWPRSQVFLSPTFYCSPCTRYASTVRPNRRPAFSARVAVIVLTSSAIAGFLFRAFLKSRPDWAETQGEQPFLDGHAFRSFTLLEKVPVSSTSTIFRVRPTHGTLDAKHLQELWNTGVWSVQVKQPQLQIVRAYTPLPPDLDPTHVQDDDSSNDLRLLIRREEGGEVSGYLHRLPVGSHIDIRRANVEYQFPPDATEVIFLAGGTGIAPAMQLLEVVSRHSNVHCHVLWATRRREDCVGAASSATLSVQPGLRSWLSRLWAPSGATQTSPEALTSDQVNPIVAQLRTYEHLSKDDIGHRIHVDYFIDDEKSFINPENIGNCLRKGAMHSSSASKAPLQILISGPDGFVTHWAGKKPPEGSKDSQGPLGGILSNLDTKGWKVWKL